MLWQLKGCWAINPIQVSLSERHTLALCLFSIIMSHVRAANRRVNNSQNKWHHDNLIGWKREGDLSSSKSLIYWDLQELSLQGSPKKRKYQVGRQLSGEKYLADVDGLTGWTPDKGTQTEHKTPPVLFNVTGKTQNAP